MRLTPRSGRLVGGSGCESKKNKGESVLRHRRRWAGWYVDVAHLAEQVAVLGVKLVNHAKEVLAKGKRENVR